MSSLDEPEFMPGPIDPGLAQRRADQATAKFLPELLNSREFRERYEIRRRPSACARFTSGLLWALAGAAVLLLALLAFPQLLLLLGGDVGRALSTRSSSGAPAVAWPAAAQQLSQQHLPNPHPYQHAVPHPAGQHAVGGRVAAVPTAAGATDAAPAAIPTLDAAPGDLGAGVQQPTGVHGSDVNSAKDRPPAPAAPAARRPPAAAPPLLGAKTPPAPPTSPPATAAAAPLSTSRSAAARRLPSDHEPLRRVVQLQASEPAHASHKAPPPPTPKLPLQLQVQLQLPLPSPPTSSPVSTASLCLRFRCWQWQPPLQVQGQGQAHAPGTAGIAATAASVHLRPDATHLLLVALMKSALLVLVLVLALLAAAAMQLAAPLSGVLRAAACTFGSAVEDDPDESKTPSTDTPATQPPSTDASTSAVTEASAVSTADPPAQPLPRSDSHSGLNLAARPQQLLQLQAGGCSPVAHSPMESTAASGGTWSSRSGGAGEDGEDRAQPYTAAATSAGQSAARIKAPAEEASEQASDTTPATKWSQFETPSRAPSFRDQLPPLPEAFAVCSVTARVEHQSATLQPQTATPQLQASDCQTAPHRQELSTPSAGAATSGSAATSTSTGSRSRLPSVLRPLVAYGMTPVSQPPAAGGTGAACAAAAPGAVSDGASPLLDATSSAAPWPFVYPDSVERARLTATPTASTTSTSGSEGVRAAAAAAAAAALTPAVWSGTAALAGSAGGADDSDHPIFDLSRYDSNGDELPLLPPSPSAVAASPSQPTAAAPQPRMPGLSRLPRLSVLPDPDSKESMAHADGASAAADGGAGRPPPHHRWRLAKKAVSRKLHAARRTATDTSAHRDSHNADSVSGGSGSGGSGGGLVSGAAVNAALQAAADAADQAAETPRLAAAAEQQLQLKGGASLTLQLSGAAEMETPVWPPLYGRQARGAGALAAAADPAEGEGGGACGEGEGGDDVESRGHFAAEALTLADCLSVARGSRGGCATPVAAAAASAAAVATAAGGETGTLGAWSFFGRPADLCNDRAAPGVLPRHVPGPTAAAAHSPSISSVLPAALHRAPELDREHAAAAAAAVATLQSLKHSARRLVEATRAGSYWRPQDGPESAGGADADHELRMAQTELHAAASQLKQLRLSAPSGSAPPAAAPARKALAFTPAATPFAAAAAAAAKMPRRPLADISGSTPAGASGWGDSRSSDSWASIGSRVVPHGERENAAGDGDGSGAESASDSFLVTPAPRAPPVAPLPIRRSKIPLLTPASASPGAATRSPAAASMPQLHLGTAAVDDSTVATPVAAWVHTAGTPSASADSSGGLSSILAEVAAAAAAKAMQSGRKRLTDLVSPGDSAAPGEGGRVRSGLQRLVPWPVLTATGSQQGRPPAPAPTPGSGRTAAPAILFARSSLTSSVEQVPDLIGSDDGGSSTPSSSDGGISAADPNKKNCEPPAHESPRRRSSSSPASSSPASFHLAGHELPSDAEVQAFLAATALSQSPADAAAAASPPPLSPLESLLRVLPAAVEVLVVQLCALADLAAERQREVLAWHATAAAQAMLMREAGYDAHADEAAAVTKAAGEIVLPPNSNGRASFEQEVAGGAAQAASPAVVRGPVLQGAKQAAPSAAVAGGLNPEHEPSLLSRTTPLSEAAAAPDMTPGAVLGHSPATRCNSDEGRALMALIGRMVDGLEQEQGPPEAPALGLDMGTVDLQGPAESSQGRVVPVEPTLPLAPQQQLGGVEGPLFEIPLDGAEQAQPAPASGSKDLSRSLAVALEAPPANEDASIMAARAGSSDDLVAQGVDSNGSEAPATAESEEGDAEYVVVYGLVESMRTPRARGSGSRTSSMATTPVLAGEHNDGATSASVSATGPAAAMAAHGATVRVAPRHGSGAVCSPGAAAAPAAAAHESWAPSWSPWPPVEP